LEKNVDYNPLFFSTRWNSSYFMLSRIGEEHSAIIAALCYMDKPDLLISSREIVIIKESISLLAPFEEATREVSAEKFLSISKVIPLA
jgi:hypothetical protein